MKDLWRSFLLLFEDFASQTEKIDDSMLSRCRPDGNKRTPSSSTSLRGGRANPTLNIHPDKPIFTNGGISETCPFQPVSHLGPRVTDHLCGMTLQSSVDKGIDTHLKFRQGWEQRPWANGLIIFDNKLWLRDSLKTLNVIMATINRDKQMQRKIRKLRGSRGYNSKGNQAKCAIKWPK